MADGKHLKPVVHSPQRCHPAMCYIATLSQQSRRVMRGSLDVVASEVTGGLATHMTCPWSGLRYRHTRRLRASLVKRYKPATANRHLAALRGVLKQCFRLGLMGADDYYRAIDFRNVRVAMQKRRLKVDEIEALFVSCDDDDDPQAKRDAALLALLYGAGLRRSEIVGLRVCDYRGEVVMVRCNDSNERVVPLSKGIRQRLETWLSLRGRRHGPLFLGFNRNGELLRKGLGQQSVLLTCYRRADAAGIDRFSPNDLRRSFMKDLLDAGADIVAVRRLMGTRRLDARVLMHAGIPHP